MVYSLCMDKQKEREPMSSVQIRRPTYARLKRYRKAQKLPPSLTDLATVAIELYLDAHEGSGEAQDE